MSQNSSQPMLDRSDERVRHDDYIRHEPPDEMYVPEVY